MKNITLAIIIIFTLTISVVSQFYIIDIAQKNANQKLVGHAITDTGTASINILQEIIIIIINDSIDWGVGTINVSKGCNNATLDTGIAGPGHN